MKVLVVGAAGTVGRHVTADLAGRGAEVLALSRKPAPAGAAAGSAAASSTAGLAAGSTAASTAGSTADPATAQPAAARPGTGRPGTGRPGTIRPVLGDLADPGSLATAADGVDAVFLAWPLPTAAGAAEAVAALTGRGQRVVFLSSIAVRDVPGRGPESPGRPDGEIEALIERSGAPHTFLRPGGFMANTARWAQELRESGVVRGFAGGAGLALIDERDIAAVAVRALSEDGHDGARYVLTGPAAPTQAEQVRLIGEAVGRPFEWEEVPREEAHAGLLAAGWPPAIIEGALDHLAARVGAPEPTNRTVETVTGSPARSLTDWLAAHADLFR